MIRRDYIMRMVEEFGKFLAAIVGLKREGEYEEALKKIDAPGLRKWCIVV